MDAEYLKRNIGEVLADGLAACVVQSPEDPIDFLSQFLLNFARNKNRGEGQRHRALRIQQLQVASEARQSERAAVRAAKSQSRSLRIRAEQDFVDAATTLIWPIEVVHEFVKLLGLVLGATGVRAGRPCLDAHPELGQVYAGIVEDRDGQKSIRYFTATLGHEFMIGERLQPPAVTLSLLDPEAHSEPGTQNDESEPKPPVPYRPRSVHIANTVLGQNHCRRHAVRVYGGKQAITLRSCDFFDRKTSGRMVPS